MKKYIDIFKAIGEKTRLRILKILLKAKIPLCVCEIMDCLNECQTNISKHLKNFKIFRTYKRKKREDIESLKKRLSLRKNGKCVIGINKEKIK